MLEVFSNLIFTVLAIYWYVEMHIENYTPFTAH